MYTCGPIFSILNRIGVTGMCHGQLGQHEEAYEDYVAAIDLLDDPVRMRLNPFVSLLDLHMVLSSTDSLMCVWFTYSF